MGWKMFPVWHIVNGACACRMGVNCTSPGKHPRTRTGVKEATNNVDVLRAWWESFPGCNWGLACGPGSGLFVIDIDEAKGGFGSFAEFQNDHMPGGLIPPTTSVVSGGAGRHLYFRHPSVRIGNRVGWLPGVDVRGHGGYVILPPSNHISGGRYHWQTWVDDLAEAPSVLIESLLAVPDTGSGPGGPGRIGRTLGDLPDDDVVMGQGLEAGNRNDTMHRLASRWFRELGVHAVYAVKGRAFQVWSRTTQFPPFSWEEAEAAVDSARRFVERENEKDQAIIAAFARRRLG
ncbi:hypothetical protein B0T42_11325 [Rathayibacter sp. VKM Ac-2630]|nr:hypothetical protein B0T42_11325 [Rathayibacter sp. VKM Ac-2630]